MRKLFAMLTVVALATGMTACSDDDGTETPKDPTTTNFNLRARGGNVMVTLTTSDYTIDIPAADADWIGLSEQSQGEVVVLSVKPNTTGAERSTTVTLAEKTTGTTLAYMNIKQSENSLYSGDFLIEESFFTSCPLPATGKVDKAHGDQYIKIRNNTGQDLYADGRRRSPPSRTSRSTRAKIPGRITASSTRFSAFRATATTSWSRPASRS